MVKEVGRGKTVSLKHVAIIMAFNDVEIFHGGSRSGIKSGISYFDQFLMLAESIREKWREKNFTYRIVALHSQPFNDAREDILHQMGVDVIRVDTEALPWDCGKQKLKIRPAAYMLNFDCDFRLILDVDMLAIAEPKFDFRKDIQATYGGNKYSQREWKAICNYLDCEMPRFPSLIKIYRGNYGEWSFLEHYLYQTGYVKKRIFPYFNNGAILVRNDLAEKLGTCWLEYRKRYTKYILENKGLDIDQDGQDVIGLAINQITDNWGALPRGCNFMLQEKFYLGRRMINRSNDIASLVHYINLSEGNRYYEMVESRYRKIRAKYYKSPEATNACNQ